ncbi:hypothetical protein Vadar_017602 [Vaccinium darrowii]|uniref:Uncharacterized protein n=1 Tax=Vaccinium darrowii TaxID=229202 RepID=A0ACB7YMT5_9ERIC|nr:hypothetical protein Vadar_017602 [Vaccinium darrowii]
MLCGRPAIDMLVDEEQHSLVLWAKQVIKENRIDQLIDPSLRGQISAHCLKAFVDVANKCIDIHSKGRPTMADVVVRLDCVLAVDEQFGETAPRDDFLPRGDAPSSSTLALYSENTQHQNRSKGKVSKVFQKTIAFLAKGADIKWQRTNVYSPNGENSPVSSTGARRMVIEQLFLSSAASGPNEADLKRQILSTPDLRIFSLSQMKTATENFREDRLLGQGGYGPVYRGWLVEKNGNRSVKKLDGEITQGFKERQGLMPNEGPEKMLVYEYLPNGSLDRFLFDKKRSSSLDWLRRYRIVTGIARDGQLNPKISDFGMARLFPGEETHLDTSRIIGTFRYMAPEYIMHGCMSVKTDVYSFGVLVLEIVSGRKNHDREFGGEQGDLLTYAWTLFITGKSLDLVDPSLARCNPDEAAMCIQLGLLCCQENVADRPDMNSVLLMLSSDSFTLPRPGVPGFFIDEEDLYLDSDPVETTTILLTQHSGGKASGISSTPVGSATLPLHSSLVPSASNQQFQYPMVPSQPNYSGNNFGGNRNNRSGNRFNNRNGNRNTFPQGYTFPVGACQICGRTNHQASTCYYRQNLEYRPPQYGMQYGMQPQFGSQGLSQTYGAAMIPNQGQNGAAMIPNQGQNGAVMIPTQGQNFQQRPQAQALMVASDFSGINPGQSYYQQQNCYSSFPANLVPVSAPPQATFQSYGGVTTPPVATTPHMTNSTSVPWFFDSGASTHVTNNLNQIQVPTSQAPTAVTVGNGQSVPVSISGFSDQPSGSSGVLQSGPLSPSSFL